MKQAVFILENNEFVFHSLQDSNKMVPVGKPTQIVKRFPCITIMENGKQYVLTEHDICLPVFSERTDNYPVEIYGHTNIGLYNVQGCFTNWIYTPSECPILGALRPVDIIYYLATYPDAKYLLLKFYDKSDAVFYCAVPVPFFFTITEHTVELPAQNEPTATVL